MFHTWDEKSAHVWWWHPHTWCLQHFFFWSFHYFFKSICLYFLFVVCICTDLSISWLRNNSLPSVGVHLFMFDRNWFVNNTPSPLSLYSLYFRCAMKPHEESAFSRTCNVVLFPTVVRQFDFQPGSSSSTREAWEPWRLAICKESIQMLISLDPGKSLFRLDQIIFLMISPKPPSHWCEENRFVAAEKGWRRPGF